MNYKNFEELTYEEKVEFIENEFGIAEISLHNIEEVITQCHDIWYVNNDVVNSYEAIQNISLEIAIRIYTEYDNLKEAYINCTSINSAIYELKKIYTTLKSNSKFKEDLKNLIDKYYEIWKRG